MLNPFTEADFSTSWQEDSTIIAHLPAESQAAK